MLKDLVREVKVVLIKTGMNLDQQTRTELAGTSSVIFKKMH